jgi:hypothetical protein
MKQVTAKELQTLDPKRFDKEYYEWTHYAADRDWWEWIEDSFKCDMQEAGVRVERVFFDTYPARARFDGHVDVARFMNHLILDEKYPALALAVEQDGSYVSVWDGRYGNSFNLNEHLYNTAPEGIFKYLDAQAWEELIDDQLSQADIESCIEEFCNRACAKLARDLEDNYEHLTSVESFIESCECNEITFDIETEEEKEHEVHCEN